MFGKNTIIYEREMVPYEKSVTIKRAPTDESVALLNEMQEKTLQNIIRSVTVKDNTMNAVVLYLVRGPAIDAIDFIAKFTFNGRSCELKGQVSRRDIIDTNAYGNQAVANSIAMKLCDLMIKELFKDFGVSNLEQIRSGMML